MVIHHFGIHTYLLQLVTERDTLQELRQFNFAYKSKGFFPIPTLRELLEFIQDKDFVVNIELKTDVFHYEGIEEKVYQLVQELGVAHKVYYSSFYLPSVLKMKSIDQRVYAGYLMEWSYQKKYKELLEHQVKAFHPKYRFLNQERMADLKSRGIQVATWTVPDKNEYERLKELGVDIIIANEYLR